MTKKKIKKDITEAVKNIPSLVIEQVGLGSSSQKNTHHYSSTPKHATFLLWFGVGVITLSVFGIWIINTNALFQKINSTKSAELQILDSAKEDLSAVFSSITEPEKQTTKEKINQIITAAKAEQEKQIVIDNIKSELPVLLTTSTTTSTEITTATKKEN